MKKGIILAVCVILIVGKTNKTFAWGKTGHEITGKLAWHFLDDSTRQVITDYLGGMSFEEATTWMDESRSNSYFTYMRSWHYVDMDKGEKYVPSKERNSLTILHSAITELRHYNDVKKKDIKRDLLLIFHIVGDLHQPLHNGYNSDRGGNDIQITSPFVSGNLHSVWDTQILEYKKFKADSCLELYKTFDSTIIADLRNINELKWMYQSRSLLDTVYSFQDNFLDKRYIDSNSLVIKKQLLIAGIRLAAILEKIFKSPAQKNN